MKIDKYFHLYGTKDSVVFEEIEQPEKDFVSRKEATRHLKKRLMETAINNVGIKENADYVYSEMAENRIDIWMDELPAAQPERMNGKWEMKWHSLFKREVPTCSVCKAGFFFITNFCPKCGADMREGGQCENN